LVYEILKELERNGSSKKKLEILNQNKDNENLKTFFKLALDSHIVFNIKKIPEYISNYEKGIDLKIAYEELELLIDRSKTGYAAIEHLKTILESLCYENANVIERIIKRDPNCGVDFKTINKVWPNLIGIHHIALCSLATPKLIGKMSYPAIAQVKEDGARINIIVENGKVVHKSRAGKQIDFLGCLEKEFENFLDGVYDGECLVLNGAQVLDRSTGNGIINKALKGTISEDEASSVIVRFWDYIPLEAFKNGKCFIPYGARLEFLEKEIEKSKYSSKVFLVECRKVNNWEEALNYYDEKLLEGKEGIIVKEKDSIWEGKRLKTHIKLKEEKDCDLLCIGVTPHNKDPELIGSLICGSKDGKLRTDVGSGLTDELRKKDMTFFIGEIITVKFNSVIEKKNEKIKSLFLPRFVEVRNDKTEADNLSEIEKES